MHAALRAAILGAVSFFYCCHGLVAREWVDTTGKFRIEAEFVKVEGDSVVLKSTAGKEFKVPLAKLCEADQKYIKAQQLAAGVSADDKARAKQLTDEAMALLDVDPKGNAAQIQRKLLEAGKLNPADIRAEFLCGIYNLMVATDPEKAAGNFQTCLDRKPDDIAVLSNLALCQVKSGNPGDAVKSFEAAAKLAPGLPAITQNLGRALKVHNDGRLKMPEKSVEAFADLYARLVASKDFPASRPQLGWLLVNIRMEDVVDPDVEEEKPEIKPSSKLPKNVIAGGTGFVVLDEYIVTNRHVVGDAKEVLVRVPGRDLIDGLLKGNVVAVSDEADIAVVQCPRLSLPAVEISATVPRRGSDVMVLGFPQFSQLGATIKSTRGAITSLPAPETDDMMLLDAEMNSGNSGGPVANKQGQVVAVATAVFKPIGGTGGRYGASVPIAEQMTFLKKHIPELAASAKAGAELDWPDVDERVSRSTVLILITGSADEVEKEAGPPSNYAGLIVDPSCPACSGSKVRRARGNQQCTHCRGLGLDREAVMSLAELEEQAEEEEAPPTARPSRPTRPPAGDPPVVATGPKPNTFDNLPPVENVGPSDGGDDAGQFERPTPKAYRAPKGEVIDLIALTREENYHPVQKWNLVDGELHCIKGLMMPKVSFPIDVPEEYDLEVVVTQHKMRSGFCVVVPNGHGDSVVWLVGYEWGNAIGLSLGDPYTPVAKAKGLIQAEVKYTCVLSVRHDRLEGYINGKRLFSYVGSRARLVANVWHKSPDAARIAVGCDDPTTFHSVRLVEVTE